MISFIRFNRHKVFIILLSVCLVNILPRNVHTSPVTVDGKYSLDSFFHPITDQEQCNNYYTNNQYVCDPNSYMTYPDKQKVGAIMQQSVTNPIISCPLQPSGIHFGVLIISSFNDYHSHKINQGMDTTAASQYYAKLYHEKWEIGTEECNNGVLIFMNVEDRYLYISTSTYLKTHYISDEYVNHHVMPRIKPYLKKKQYAEAIIKIIELVTDKAQEQAIHKMSQNENTQTQSDDWWIAVVIAVMFIGCVVWVLTRCDCEGRDNNNNHYRDEGVPFERRRNNNYNARNNIHRMNAHVPPHNYNGLRSRAPNVYNVYPKQQFKRAEDTVVKNKQQQTNADTCKGAGSDVKSKKLENEIRDNDAIVSQGKRTKHGGGGGTSWGNETEPKRTNATDGGGGSW